MVWFINRLLYSLYCFENRLSYAFLRLFRPILFMFAKVVYMCNFYGNKKHKSLECYMEENDKFVKKSISDLDYGNSLRRSEFGLFLIITSYFSLLLMIILRLMYLIFALKLSFKIYGGVVVVLSASFIQFSCFRKDKFKEYFEKFRNDKNNKKWHVVCVLVVIGACIACYCSIMQFYAECIGFKPL